MSNRHNAVACGPPLLFKEDWRFTRHERAATDENMRFTPEVVTHDRIEAKARRSRRR